jgi:hypothetical protein
MQQEAINKASEKLNAEVDKSKQLQTAASNFLDFYLAARRSS